MKRIFFFLVIVCCFQVTVHGQNVGIGTNAPAFKLDVNGRMRVKTGTLGNVSTSSGVWMEDYRDGTNRVFIGMQDSIRFGFYGSAGGIGWGLNFNATNGHVGIGDVATDKARLQVYTNSGTAFELGESPNLPGLSNFMVNSGGFLSPGIGFNARWNGSNYQSIGSTYAAALVFTALDGKLRYRHSVIPAASSNTILGRFDALLAIDNNGWLGLNTETPQARLHVVGTDEILRLSGVSPMIKFVQINVEKGFINVSGDDLKIGTLAGNDPGRFIIRVNASDRMFVHPDGRVSIGTATAANGYLLSVNGKAICNELKVQLTSGWPDYVFTENYKLRSLEELKYFIQRNKHLPNIPSAEEVERNGIEVGDMQKRMIEKIEELTLYVLQLEEKVNSLSKQINKK